MCCVDCKQQSSCTLNKPTRRKISQSIKSQSNTKQFRSRVDGRVVEG